MFCVVFVVFFFFKQKTAYEMRISDWSSDVCSSDLLPHGPGIANYLLFFERNPAWFYGAGTPTCALLARRSTFETLGRFDPAFRLIEDAEQIGRASCRERVCQYV